jgi:hypothetical protein
MTVCDLRDRGTCRKVICPVATRLAEEQDRGIFEDEERLS